LDVHPERCVAIEDSSNGLRAAAAARMTVIAVPNPHYPPNADALSLAAAVVPVVGQITPGWLSGSDRRLTPVGHNTAPEVLAPAWHVSGSPPP
jgi:hypothetical protein